MAFSGILIFNVILFIILCASALGATCLVAVLILGIVQFVRKRKGKTSKKWLRVLRIMLTVIGLLAILPFLILLMISS